MFTRYLDLTATFALSLVSFLLPWMSVGAQQPTDSGSRTHILLVGDSTVTDDAGWGKSFAACLGHDATCTNLSRGGRSSSSFREEGLWEKALAMKPDWVLIQFGHNDQPGHPRRENEPDIGYRTNMERYVDEARAAGIEPVLVTPISRRQWSKANDGSPVRIASTLEPYAEVVRQIAAEKNVSLVDLHAHSIEIYQSLGKMGCEIISPTKDGGQLDGTHLNEAGGALFGAVVAMDCRSYVPSLSGFFPTAKLAELQKAHRPKPIAPRLGSRQTSKPRELKAQGSRTILVAADGTGDCRTIQEAVQSAPSANRDRTIIKIRSGTYPGQIIVPAEKTNLTFAGDDSDSTIITYALTVHDPIPPSVPEGLNGYGVVVLANGFHANDVTFQQLAGDHGQAIAVHVIGDDAKFHKCQFLGWQDTLRIDGDDLSFRDCYIEGRVDYIYGSASAVFENCRIHAKADGYVTAASTPPDKEWGFVFIDCELTGANPNSTYLGRPWRPYASVAYVNCRMDDSIKPEGWHNWGNPENEKTARYSEFLSAGSGGRIGSRAKWARQLTEVEAAQLAPELLLRTSASRR
jgi:pectinesterase